MNGVARWLASHHVGASSQALAAATLGVIDPTRQPSYPHDVDDFGRCVELWRLEPNAKQGLQRLADVSVLWNKLAQIWQELLALYETDREGCNRRIREVVGLKSGFYSFRKGPDGRWDSFPESAR